MGDWDRKPDEKPSIFVRLKSQGESIKMRIVASPYREMKVWPEAGGQPVDAKQLAEFTPGQWLRIKSDPDWRPQETYYLIGINRANGFPVIFSASPGVYGKIREYAQDLEWGDPRGYDVTITRTETPGKGYYEVKPSPNKTQLMKSELEKIQALDLADVIPGARKASEPQIDDIPDGTEPEPLPWDQPAGSPSKADMTKPATTADDLVGDDDTPPEHPDTVIEDIGDEPVNLDDIPF
jgi:hypothetical protein